MKKKKNYWTDQHDQLVADYVQEKNSEKKNLIYNELRPTLLILINGILHRYFLGNFRESEVPELIEECESNLIENTFHKYNPEKSAYAYFGTSAKHFYFDVFKCFPTKIQSETEIVSIYETDQEGELIYDLIEQEPVLEKESIEDLKYYAKEKIMKLILLPNLHPTATLILKSLIDLINSHSDYGRFFASFFLLKNTGLSKGIIRHYLNQFEIKQFFMARHELEFYASIIEGRESMEAIKLKLNEYEEERKEEYKIENGAEKRTQRKKDKQKNKTVSQRMG